ncbi:MAG: carbohydrate ABC transporter permease [Clostridiales bacterium]|nr:MAG: carbohydrate ABC transporter permease [Clostridiales bacterium]
MKKKKIKRGLTLLFLFVLCLIFLIPLFLMILTSLKSMPEIMASQFVWKPEQWLFSNYREAMEKGDWFVYFKNTFLVTVITVAISLVLNSMAGYGFARIPFRGRNTLFFFALTGMMVPQQITMIPVFINLKNFPLVGGNDILGHGGSGMINTYAGLILPYIAGAFGVFLCRQFYMNFPVSLDDAAKIDGCSRFMAYFRIYLPLSKPILATLAVLKASQTWNDYLWPLIMVNKDETMTVQLAVVAKFTTEYSIQWNLLMAATALIILPLLVLFIFTQKYFVEGIVTTGMKG